MNARMDNATALKVSLALTDAAPLPPSQFSFESPKERRAREARVAREALMQVATDKIERRRKVMRDAAAELPSHIGYASGPDEYDSAAIDRFEFAKDLLRQAHAERRALRNELYGTEY